MKLEQLRKGKIAKTFMAILLLAVTFTSCKKDENDPEPEKAKPSIANVEIGLNNEERGVTGRDFHLNADIVAGSKIDVVEIKITPISTESYAGPWSFSLKWTEFKGAKNSNVHKHFTIPGTAVEGKYDFIIIVKDENGTVLEEKRKITIIKPENLPVDPKLGSFIIATLDNPERMVFDYNATGGYIGDGLIKMNETLNAQIHIDAVKGDGKMYIVLINKKHNHRPESIAAIDPSKTIVWAIKEHKNLTFAQVFTSYTFDLKATPPITYATFDIGATSDFNLPSSNPITGLKAWESGNYYIGVLYTNTTYNVNLFHYTEVKLNM